MALIDPCLSLSSFDRDQTNANHPGDEREVVNNDEEDEPLSPASISKTLTAPSTPLLSSTVPATAHSTLHVNHNNNVPPTSQLSTLPTVLQSVFSYIFTDANGQQRTTHIPSVNPNLPSTSHSILSYPTTPTACSSLAPPLPLVETSRSVSAPPVHFTINTNIPSTPTSSSSSHYTENEAELSEIHEYENDSASECLTPVQEGEGIEGEVNDSTSTTVSIQTTSTRHCAILDLDETLLHSFFPDKVTYEQYQHMISRCLEQEEAEANGTLSPDERTLYTVDVGDGTIVVLMLRPFLRTFLRELFEHYDVGVWSAGGKLYVDAICRVLFPSDGKLKPLFQFCWDDVQIDCSSSYSYTKPLTTISNRFPKYKLSNVFLIDNRKENGYFFPSQLIVAPDYLPRPWEACDRSEHDCWLEKEAILECQRIVHNMQFDQTSLKRNLPMDHMNNDEGEVGTTFYMEDIDMSVDDSLLSHSS